MQELKMNNKKRKLRWDWLQFGIPLIAALLVGVPAALALWDVGLVGNLFTIAVFLATLLMCVGVAKLATRNPSRAR